MYSQSTALSKQVQIACYIALFRNGTYKTPMSIYVPSNHIMSELRCYGNLLTSSKAVPLCLRQVLIVRMSIIQISDRYTIFLTISRFLWVIFFIICHNLSLPCEIDSEWRISLAGDFSLPCGIAFTTDQSTCP